MSKKLVRKVPFNPCVYGQKKKFPNLLTMLLPTFPVNKKFPKKFRAELKV